MLTRLTQRKKARLNRRSGATAFLLDAEERGIAETLLALDGQETPLIARSPSTAHSSLALYADAKDLGGFSGGSPTAEASFAASSPGVSTAMEAVATVLQSPPRRLAPKFDARLKHSLRKVATNGIVELSEAVRELHNGMYETGLQIVEDQLFSTALQTLANKLAPLAGLDETAISRHIEEILSSALARRLAWDEARAAFDVVEYDAVARVTRVGEEELTRELTGPATDLLDSKGIARVGTKVEPGDVLVGKCIPLAPGPLTAEEKLVRAIFKEKADPIRDTSLRLPPGTPGVVLEVEAFARRAGDELPPGVNDLVRISVVRARPLLDELGGASIPESFKLLLKEMQTLALPLGLAETHATEEADEDDLLRAAEELGIDLSAVRVKEGPSEQSEADRSEHGRDAVDETTETPSTATEGGTN
jgi:RNA polymerase Rpb2, domain 6